jgi:hypothetical protein
MDIVNASMKQKGEEGGWKGWEWRRIK